MIWRAWPEVAGSTAMYNSADSTKAVHELGDMVSMELCYWFVALLMGSKLDLGD